MKNAILLIALTLMCVDCAMFNRRSGPEVAPEDVKITPPVETKRTTRRSIEEESMLGESSGSLWSGRGQASFLFTNNNQRLLGDLLDVKIDGYPKEQIQMKVNTIAKLLAQILNDQKQEIKLKEEKMVVPPALPAAPAPQAPVQQRGLASTDPKAAADPAAAAAPAPAPAAPVAVPVMSAEGEKQIKKIDEEAEEIKALQGGKDFPIRSIPTRVVEVQKDGSYKVKGEKPFMIGKREYKLEIAGYVKSEDFDDKGISAEVLMEPTFEVKSEQKSENL